MLHHQRVAAVVYLIISTSVRAGEDTAAIQITNHDGMSLQGRLAPSISASLRLEVDGAEFPLRRVQRLRFARNDTSPMLAPVLHRIQLRDKQHVTGTLLGIEGDRILVRTAWSETLALPRGVVERIAHTSGWLPVAVEDFEGDPVGWTLTEDSLVVQGETTSGKRSLRLVRAGQCTFRPVKAVADGRMSVNVHLPEKRATGTWLAEFSFADGEKARWVRIELDGPGKEYVTSIPGKAAYLGAVPRAAGWHRLQVEFTADRILLLVDEYVLWSGPRRDFPGPLAACKFTCEKASGGAVLLDDFAISRGMAEFKPSEPGDVTQDAIVSLEGDESFGRVQQLRGLRIVLKSIGREHECDWRTVREVLLPREGLATKETSGDHVRVRLVTNDGGRDEIEGAIQRFDGNHLTLSHAMLGDVRLPVARISEIRPVFRGRRVPIESAPRHVGTSLKRGFVLERGEGESLRWPLKLNAAPGPAILVIELAYLPKSGPEIYVNDKRVADLARLVDRTKSESGWARLPLPVGLLKAGANTIELRLSADFETGRGRDCEIRSIRLELAQP